MSAAITVRQRFWVSIGFVVLGAGCIVFLAVDQSNYLLLLGWLAVPLAVMLGRRRGPFPPRALTGDWDDLSLGASVALGLAFVCLHALYPGDSDGARLFAGGVLAEAVFAHHARRWAFSLENT